MVVDTRPTFCHAAPAMNTYCATFRLLEAVARRVDGITVDVSGNPVAPEGDVVTLYSVNINPDDGFHGATIDDTIDAWRAVPGVLFGCFQLPDGRYSVDVNIIRPAADRARTLEFARWNRQHSIFDATAGCCIETGVPEPLWSRGSRIRTADAAAPWLEYLAER